MEHYSGHSLSNRLTTSLAWLKPLEDKEAKVKASEDNNNSRQIYLAELALEIKTKEWLKTNCSEGISRTNSPMVN